MPSAAPELGLLALVVVGLLVRAGQAGYGQAGNLFRFARRAGPDDAWASVAWAYSSQPDGLLPIGVVRVYNPGAAPVVASVWVGTDPGIFARFSLRQGGHSRLSVRALRVGRQLRPAKEPLLGVVNGGATSCWEVPLGSAAGSRVVKVRLDQAALRSRLFTWRLRPCAIAQARTPARDLVRH